MAVGSNPIAVNPVTGELTYPDVAASGLTVAGNAIKGSDAPQTPSDHGYLAWSAPMSVAAQTSLLSVEAGAGTLRLSRIRRVPAGPVTNIAIYVSVAGVTLTAGQCFGALYTAAGALIGQTADQAAAWASVGLKTMALTGGPYTVAAGDLYVGLWYNGTTAPTVLRAGAGLSQLQSNANISVANSIAAYADTGLTTTAPATIGTKTASALHWWAALS